MPPDLKPDAEPASRQAIRLPPSDKFKSLNVPPKRPAPSSDKRHGSSRPMNNPILMGPRLGFDRVPFKARNKGKHTTKLHIAGSASPQPNLSVPNSAAHEDALAQRPAPKQAAYHPLHADSNRQDLRTATDRKPKERQAHEPHVTTQSTPIKTQRTSERVLPPPSTTAPLASRKKSDAAVELHCVLNGRPSAIEYEATSKSFAIGEQIFEWRRASFTFRSVDELGHTFRFFLHYRGVPHLSFQLDYDDHMKFRTACEKHGASATRVGDHRPPESLKKLQLESGKRGPGPDSSTIDVDILEGDNVQKCTITLNSQGMYVNNGKFKKFKWSDVSIVRAPAQSLALRIKYDIYSAGHHLKLALSRNEAHVLDKAAQAHHVSTVEPLSSSSASESPLKQTSNRGPQSESSPRSQVPSSPSSQEQDASIPSTLRAAIEDKKRQKLFNLSKPLPKPTARPARPATSGDGASGENDKSLEISPQSFYGHEEEEKEKEVVVPASPVHRVGGSSRNDPINLTSPEKPSRRLRRRARPEVHDLEEDAAPVEPTDEDFQILRNAGFHRVAHRFWDGRLMEVSVEDIARLNPRIYVNDNIIWFFLRWYLERLYTHDRSMFDKILLLNTFFYPEVRKGDSPKWVTKLPILSKHITVMPIHEAAHWSVAVIVGLDEAVQEGSSTKPTIVVLDSLGPTQNHQTFRKVVSVLRSVLRMHNKSQLTTRDYRSLRTSVPVQTNLTDCGVYLLHYVEQIFERPDVFLNQVHAAQDRTLDMGEFWREPELQTKRDDLKRRLKRLGSEENSAEVHASQDDDDDDIEVVGMEQVKRKRRKVEDVQTATPNQTQTSEDLSQSSGGSNNMDKNDPARFEKSPKTAHSETSRISNSRLNECKETEPNGTNESHGLARELSSLHSGAITNETADRPVNSHVDDPAANIVDASAANPVDGSVKRLVDGSAERLVDGSPERPAHTDEHLGKPVNGLATGSGNGLGNVAKSEEVDAEEVRNVAADEEVAYGFAVVDGPIVNVPFLDGGAEAM